MDRLAGIESMDLLARAVGEVVADKRSKSFRRLGAAFAAGGRRYERLRPGYPDQAVSWLVDGVPAGGQVADVGAGTGKLTSALLAHGFDVVAVDPSQDMLAQLHRQLHAVTTQVGTGEATGLASGTADLVTFAQSWHWVEPVAGAAEVARVLRPGGRAAWVWNFMDVREPWVAELARIWHTLDGAEATDSARHRPVLGDAFDPVDAITIDWVQPMGLLDLGELVTTRSYYLNASPSEREIIEAEVASFLTARFSSAQTVDLPYRAHCLRTRTTSSNS